MNRIIVVDDKIEKSKISNKIKFNIENFEEPFLINNIKIDILNNEELEFKIEENSKKVKIIITIEKNCCATIYIYEKNNDSKLQYKFILGENSNLTIIKLKQGLGGKEMIDVTLDQKKSCLNYFLKSFCKKKEVYDYYIYHKAPQTKSSIANDVIVYSKGNLQLQTSIFALKGNEKCKININNNIINLKNRKVDIKPNFYIDQFDVTINNSTRVGQTNKKLNNILLNNINNKDMEKHIIDIIQNEGGELYQ